MKGLPNLPDSSDLLAELARFCAEAFPHPERTPYLAGGFLRDSLRLGSWSAATTATAAAIETIPPLADLDIAVPAVGEALQRLAQELARRVDGSYVALNPAYHVARVVVSHKAPDRSRPARQTTVDLTGFSGSVEEDLARRDFTVNALALPLRRLNLAEPPPLSSSQDAVIDPFGGQADLARKRVRALGPQVFQDDPGRLLRGVRLAAQLNFRLEPETAQLIRRHAHRLDAVAPERVRNEFLAILSGDGARGQLEVLDRLDLLGRIIPELALTKAVEQPRSRHYWDVWNHLLHAVEYAESLVQGRQNTAIYSLVPWTADIADHFREEVCDGHNRRTLLKLAALFHDIAKPQTKKTDATGRTRFLGHSELGAEMTALRLTQLRFSSRSVALTSLMVAQHLRPSQLRQGDAEPSRRAIYRYFRDLQEVAIDTIYLAIADYLAAKGPEIALGPFAEHVRMLSNVLQTGMQPATEPKPERLLTGNDLMRHFNLPPGPQLGRLLKQLGEAQAVGELTTKEDAIRWTTALIEERDKGHSPGAAGDGDDND